MDPITLGLIGAGASTLGSVVGNYLGAEAQKDSARIQQRALEQALREGKQLYGQAGEQLQQGYTDVANMYDPYAKVGTTALSQLAGGDFTTPVGEFAFKGDVNQYLDPSMKYQQEQAQRALEQSAIARGGLLSGGTAKALQNQAMQFAQTDYGNAYNRMQNDKNFAYQQFRDKFAQQQANNAIRMQQLQGLTNIGQNATGSMAQARQGLASNQANLNQNLANMNAGMLQDISQARAMKVSAYPMANANIVSQVTSPQNMSALGSLF